MWYTLKIEWNNVTKDFRAYRDGVKVWDAKYDNNVPMTSNGIYPVTSPYPWLPVDFKLWLGSGPGGLDNKIPGTTFRKFQTVSLWCSTKCCTSNYVNGSNLWNCKSIIFL